MVKLAHVMAAALLLAAPVHACELAGKAYTFKVRNSISTKFFFNETCTEAIQNYRGNITRHPMKKSGEGWSFSQTDDKFHWIISPSGRSATLTGPEWRIQGRMVRNKTP